MENETHEQVLENEGQVQEVKEEVSTEFNPSSFAEDNEVVSTGEESAEENKEVVESTETKNEEKEEDLDEELTWDKLADLESVKEVSPEEGKQEEGKQEETTKTELTPQQIEHISKELGIEAKDIDTLKEKYQALVDENNKLKESQLGELKNEKIEKYENYLKLADEQLVREDLKGQGFDGDRLEDIMERLIDTGLMDVEAEKVRNLVTKAIQSEREVLNNSLKEQDAKQESSREESVKLFTDYMAKQDTLFGFKITTKQEELPKVQQKHVEYVTSGEYLRDITDNEKNLAESAWLWKNRDVLTKALINRGKQTGRKEVLENLGNPDTVSSQRFIEPSDNTEFDHKRFIQ